MSEKETRDYWSDYGQIFFHYGKGYGLTPELKTICLGREEDIKKFFDTGELNNQLNLTQRQVLRQVFEYRQELKDNGRTVEIKRPGNFRSRPTRTFKRRAANTRQAKARKRVPVH